MALMDYGRCRKYRQYLECLSRFYKVDVDWEDVGGFHSAAQYSFLINKIIRDSSFLSDNKKNVIKDMKEYASVDIVPDKYFNWLKADNRAACYTWFWLVSNTNPWRSTNHKRMGLINESDFNNFNSACDMNEGMFSESPDYKAINSEICFSVQELSIELEKERAKKDDFLRPFLGGVNVGSVVSNSANGINFSRLSPVNDLRESYIYSSMILIDDLDYQVNEKIHILDNVHDSWGRNLNQFTNPFKWIDLSEDESIHWLWDYMKKNHLGCDLLPSSIKQMKDFILATFDNWAGWTDEQFSKQKENAKAIRARSEESISLKKLLKPTDADECRRVFLENARNAWMQKRHREKLKKDFSGIKLTAQSKKKLLAIHNATGIEPNALLKSFIDDAYRKIKSENSDS
ncbi:hypothetical protein [uncultured Cedecea sp.]|uniref:hypothetical protein n=1 Tax=uncultured Cedecea sp. TaxID=988762 RepID=UPI00262BEE41|nr:hypothetical protein [uncultured Cedecea sp.]